MNWIIGIMALLISLNLQAQSPLEIGGIQANAGLSVGDDVSGGYIGADYGLIEDITVGGRIWLASNFFQFAVNGNYHFDELIGLPSEWNVYGGASLGYLSIENASDFDIGLQAGGRYFFTDQWAVNAEIGGTNNISGLRLGATYKF